MRWGDNPKAKIRRNCRAHRCAGLLRVPDHHEVVVGGGVPLGREHDATRGDSGEDEDLDSALRRPHTAVRSRSAKTSWNGRP